MINLPLWFRVRWLEVLIVSLLFAMSGPLMRQG
jgi:hypothetical protein